jgi:hypothetical protein
MILAVTMGTSNKVHLLAYAKRRNQTKTPPPVLYNSLRLRHLKLKDDDTTKASRPPTELWTKVLKNVDLNDLWSNARLVCRAWNYEINNVVRLIVYHGGGCQVSTLEEVVEGVKYYD